MGDVSDACARLALKIKRTLRVVDAKGPLREG